MIYIVEGIDRAGKSTLSNLIAAELGCKVFHDDFKPNYINDKELFTGNENLLDELLFVKFNVMVQMAELFDNIVIDRFHLTEKVYNLARGQNFATFILIDMLLRGKAKLILVMPDSVNGSSIQHGSDLSEHQHFFEKFYSYSKMDKVKVKQTDIFNDPQKAIMEALK